MTNLRVIRQNEDCEKAKYPSHDKSDSKWFYLCYDKIKQVKDHCLDPIHSVSVVLVWYILTKWPFYRGEDNKKQFMGTWILNRYELSIQVSFIVIREIKIHVYGIRQTANVSREFLRIENKHIKTVQNDSFG